MMPLNRDGWHAAANAVIQRCVAVKDLADSVENAKAIPVGLSGERYEFPMTQQQINAAKADLLAEARAARDALNAAIQAATS